MICILYYIIGFLLFAVLQSLFINGIHESLKGQKLVDGISGKVQYQGMILYMIAPKILEKYKYRFWSKSLYTCVQCMGSTYGALTFWPLVIYLFGFHFIEIFVFIMDVFILVYLNRYFYNKL